MKKIQIKRFFECLIPVTMCNLKCSYCYVIQRDYRNMKLADMKYSPEHIGRCLTQERLGGPCFFSICGAGETLMQPETLCIAHELLKNGHIVNITTNGTLKKRFDDLHNFTADEMQRLHISFSLHYTELKKRNLLDTFFENVLLVKQLGGSFVVQLNLCDEYIPFIHEIKTVCMDRLGGFPQLAATRDEEHNLKNISLLTALSTEEYLALGKTFDSELFNYTIENFNVKRKEFCYAGERSGVLNLATGELNKCYSVQPMQRIFDDENTTINFEPVGKNCHCEFCLNSSHFMSLGVIDNDDSRSYCSLRNRPEAKWFNDTMEYALSQKLWNNNPQYDESKQRQFSRKQYICSQYYKIRHFVGRIVRFIAHQK